MRHLMKPAGQRKPAPTPTEAERRAIHNLLSVGKATREESRIAVRCLLRLGSRKNA